MSKEEEKAMRELEQESGQGSVFDRMPDVIKAEKGQEEGQEDVQVKEFVPEKGKKASQHKYSTAHFKISLRKLNMLGRQMSGKPIDYAILQMEFSEKRAAKRLKNMLVVARKHAIEQKGLDHSKLVVDEAWVTKGQKVLKRVDIKGRGRTGIKQHPDSKITVILREGKTVEEKAKLLRERKLKKIKHPGYLKEDKPIVNAASIFAW
ncbi:hypothetical protein M422DRAFT_40625 [Sphaerobolus stellatus SS14]|nr:hypothetical protein M422DRAFT_40625 [Sphaerobolus stellatus SS14]